RQGRCKIRSPGWRAGDHRCPSGRKDQSAHGRRSEHRNGGPCRPGEEVTMNRALSLATLILMAVAPAFGHVTVQPKQSAPGAIEKYVLRVPTEKFVPTVRVDVEFPSTLNVSAFEPKAGWKIEEKKDSSGKIVGVTLNGSLGPGESTQFNFTARNPGE